MKSISQREKGPPAAPKPTTIADVAARAGVSQATVSRVLNNTVNVDGDARARVLEAVAELGYQPNRLASNLRRRRAALIAAVVSDIENPHFTEAVRAVEDATFSRGYRVLVCNTDESAEKQRAYLELLAAERVAGVLLSPTDPDAPEIGELLDMGAAVVAFDRPVSDPRAGAVMVDNAGGLEAATRELIRLGHRSIGLIAGPAGVDTADKRRAGYRRAMAEASLEPVEADGRFRIDGGRRAVEGLLDHRGPLTALIACNNLMTIGALQALAARGIAIPDQMSVVAVDDPFWCGIVDPPLTALGQPVRAMAAAAVDLLFKQIDGEGSKAERITFDFEFKMRGSCAAPVRGRGS
jgi:LacI family transcriptional regulator